MPTYEYACSSCKNEWEFEQSIKDAPITECPRCHEQTARRQISRGTGFILKGSGWYADLYSSASNTKPADDKPSGGSTPPAAGGSSEGSSGSSGSSGTPAPSTPSSGSSAKSASSAASV